jgi:hypothetical protein
MATSAISSADLDKIRNGHHVLSAVRLNVVRPEIVASYSITGGSQAVITDLSGSLSSGSVSDVLVGRRVQLTDGTYKQYSTVRKTSDASNIYINALGEGQGGYANRISPAQSALTTANIYNDFPLHGEYSRVVNKTNPILPRWDLAFSNQTSSAIPPIANTGTHQSASVSYGSTATFTLPYSGSNTSFAFGGETISSYSWSLPPGVSFASGFSATDAVINVEAEAGQHLISLTVTDSNSQTHTAYIWLFVDDNTTYKTLNDELQARIVADNRDLNGRTIEFELNGQVSESVILSGSMIHLQTEQTYGGQTLTQGVVSDIFVGYVQSMTASHDGNTYTTRITAVSPFIYLQSVATPPQVIFEKNSPSNWTQVTSALSNPRGALSYMRWQCQNLFALHDIDCPYTEPRKKSYEFSGVTVGSHLQTIGDLIAGNVGSASDGTLVVRKNPVLRDNTFRNALAVGCTFGVSDIVGTIDYNEPIHTVFQHVQSGAFAYDGSSVNAWYGVKRWEQGAGTTEVAYFTVTASEGRDTVLEIVGHMTKDLNYPATNTIDLSRDFDVIEPVYMIWYQLTIDASYDARNRRWSNQRIVPQSVTTTWDLDNYTKSISMTFKEETFGQPAEEYFLGTGGLDITNGWLISRPVPYTPQADLFGDLTNVAVLLNTDGDLALTQNLIDATPSYFDLTNYVTGNVNDVCYDYNSSFFTSGYIVTEPLSLYVVSSSGTTLYIYRIDDIKSQSINITQLTTYTMNDSSNTTNARIACSRTTPTFAMVGWHDQTGVLVGRSTDGGTTWGTAVRVGDSVSDTDNDNVSIGMFVDDVNQVITAPNSSVEYGTYLATTTGGSFSKLANSEDNTAPQPMITGDGGTTLYVATDNDGTGGASTPDYDGDFDGGDAIGVNVQDGTDDSPVTGNGGGNGAGMTWNTYTYTAFAHDNYIGLGTTDWVTASNVTSLDIDIDIKFTTGTDFEPTNYAPIGSPPDPQTQYLIARVRWIDGGATVAETFYTFDSATASIGNPYSFSIDDSAWHTFSFSTAPVSGTPDIDTVDIQIGLSDTAGSTGNEPSSTSHITGTGVNIQVDNVKFYIDGKMGGSSVDPLLYKVTTYTATDSWTDVTPATDHIPQLPYGLVHDVLDTDNVEVFSTDDSTPKWFTSSNAMVSSSDNGASDYRTAIKIGNSMLLGGLNAFDLTTDNGATTSDKLGNLGLVWGSVGTIKKIMVVTE